MQDMNDARRRQVIVHIRDVAREARMRAAAMREARRELTAERANDDGPAPYMFRGFATQP